MMEMLKIKKPLFLVSAILVISLLNVSCATKALKIEGSNDTLGDWKKIALIELIITPPSMPFIPLLDAGIYRSVVHGVKLDIVEIHKKRIDDYTEYLGQKIKDNSNTEILFGQLLIGSEEYKNLLDSGDVKVFPVNLKNDHFPEAIIQNGSYNFFDFSETSNPYNYFNKNSDYNQNIVNLCKALNVDGVIVSTVTVVTNSVGMFGITGNRYLNIKLYFFDNSGSKILYGYVSSESESAGPKDLNNFADRLDLFKIESNRLIKTIYNTGANKK